MKKLLSLITMMTTVLVLGFVSTSAVARELSFGMQDGETSNVYKGALAFKKALESSSAGEVTVKLFPSSQLGDFKAMVAQVQAGELSMVMTGYPDMSYTIPELKLIGAPYVVSDYDHLKKIIAGSYGKKMDKAFLKKGIKVLDVWYYGTRHTTSNKPIHSIKDMSGLRLRTPNVPFLIAYAKNTGASPAPVAFAEVYLALQTNQVDAQENPLPTIEAMKFYEVQKYIALTSHFVASAGLQFSKSIWDDLSQKEQNWITQAIARGGSVSNGLTFADESSLIETFEKRGLKITRPDTGPFREAMKPYYQELESEFGAGSIDALINN